MTTTPADFIIRGRLTPEQRLTLLDAARRWLAQERLQDFCAWMEPGAYLHAAHAALLCEHLEALERREIDKLIVEMPPRHAKSYHVSERFPAWYLGRHPDHYVGLASYAAALAKRLSRRARDLIESTRYPFATRVDPEARGVNQWETTAGGGMVATGVGGPLTGFGAHVLLIDDPIKNREEADSAVIREAQWEWYQDVARTRAMPGFVQCITMTRWHEDDLVGRILNSPGAAGWTVLRLPAVAEDGEKDPTRHLRRPDLRDRDDPVGRQPGEALWPAWMPKEAYPSVEKGEISQRSWDALYQQRPTTPEGNAIKRAWLQHRYKPNGLPRLVRIQVCDSAFKEGVGNDWSVIATWGTDGFNAYLLDLWRKRVDFPDLIGALKDQYAKHRPGRGVAIEDKASGQSAVQYLRRDKTGVAVPAWAWPDTTNRQARELAKLSKEARVDAVSGFLQAGRVWLPEGAPWLADWIEEHVGFPSAAHDDQVDTTVMALIELLLTDPRRKEFYSV